ncbi:MAG: hypothetical protein V4564_05510 [Pseudomonadota bacterium]|uniref:hypothetical protein n=1 Tax=Sphingomonas sp. ERG5 TaxID=1381597 RepID=UPI00054C1A95|nr:hypothetical protein [Sphingomonas sp. ERG5]
MTPPTITARTVVLDLLGTGEHVRYSTAQLVRAGAAFGIGAAGMRTAITRLNAEARVRQIGRGAYAAGQASEPLQRRLRDWRNVLAKRIDWNGEWLLAVAGPAERANRNLWRRTLRAFDFNGFMEAEPGLWVRPDNLIGGASAARERLADFGYAETLLVVSATGLDDARDGHFRGLWNADAMNAALAGAMGNLIRHRTEIATQDPAQIAAATLLHGRAAIRAIVHDPLLPDQLCSPSPLQRLIADMDAYDHIGRRAWQTYLTA